VIDASNNLAYPGLANEAIARRAVTLDAVGKYVEFTVPRSANTIVCSGSRDYYNSWDFG
jgi:hypothetical protein